MVSVTAEADGMTTVEAGVPPARLNTAEAEGGMAPAAAAKRWALDLEGRWSERGLLGIVFTGVARMAGGITDVTAAAAGCTSGGARISTAVGAGNGAGVAALALSASIATALIAASWAALFSSRTFINSASLSFLDLILSCFCFFLILRTVFLSLASASICLFSSSSISVLTLRSSASFSLLLAASSSNSACLSSSVVLAFIRLASSSALFTSRAPSLLAVHLS